MKKDFIRDNGDVRLCVSNVAKMNIFEYAYYARKRALYNLKSVISDLKEGMVLVLFSLINIGLIAAFPITFLISAWYEIRAARREIDALNHCKDVKP
jgi:hypothetical protein